jgi:hypothetical protein
MKKTLLQLLLLLLPFSIWAQLPIIDVIEIQKSFTQSQIDDENYQDNANDLYFAFPKGDKVIVELEIVEGSMSNFEYGLDDDEIPKFSALDITGVTKKEFYVPITNLYFFTYECYKPCKFKLKITRLPGTDATLAYNTSVKWNEKKIQLDTPEISYEIVQLQEAQGFYINSGSNADFKGGKSRISIPVNLPENTVSWYYSVISFREDQDIPDFSLVKSLTGLVDKYGVANLLIDQITMPPGQDYIDVYLLDGTNVQAFLAKTQFRYIMEGTRENIKNGMVEITKNVSGPYYLGMRDPDYYTGINVRIEIIAIIANSISEKVIEEPVFEKFE